MLSPQRCGYRGAPGEGCHVPDGDGLERLGLQASFRKGKEQKKAAMS